VKHLQLLNEKIYFKDSTEKELKQIFESKGFWGKGLVHYWDDEME
jgi:hypothetical protein